MSVNKVKKVFLIMMLSIIPLVVAVNASAQELYHKQGGKIDRVDNVSGLLVIDDQIYKLRLNTKVYGRKQKILNRYALKVGQNVFFEAEIENKILYLNYIVVSV